MTASRDWVALEATQNAVAIARILGPFARRCYSRGKRLRE
jgi:hypothetical protein